MSIASKFNPRRLDVQAFARSKGVLGGTWGAEMLTRLQDDPTNVSAASALPVTWEAEGLWHQPLGGEPEIRLHLRAQATVRQTCQRCLQGLPLSLSVDRLFRFVADEAQAAALDDDSEEDVLPLDRSWDLLELLEDELIMALPLVPRHEVCPEPLPLATAPPPPVGEAHQAASVEPLAPLQERRNPFAVLAQLKRKPPTDPGHD